MTTMTLKSLPDNPWVALPHQAPFVLPDDALAVEVFNRTADSAHRLHVETPPEPFFGSIDAPIAVLLLNPGVASDGNYDDERLLGAVRNSNDQDGHFYIGAENFWWDKLVRSLSRDRPNVDVASAILSIEYFPYRSISFGCGHVRVPSQGFGFALVERAIERDAVIVIVRGERIWLGAVPKLADHGKVVRIKNPQSASLSSRNLQDDGYQKLLDALDSHGGSASHAIAACA